MFSLQALAVKNEQIRKMLEAFIAIASAVHCHLRVAICMIMLALQEKRAAQEQHDADLKAAKEAIFYKYIFLYMQCNSRCVLHICWFLFFWIKIDINICRLMLTMVARRSFYATAIHSCIEVVKLPIHITSMNRLCVQPATIRTSAHGLRPSTLMAQQMMLTLVDLAPRNGGGAMPPSASAASRSVLFKY